MRVVQRPELDDMDEELVDEIVRRYNFGGGADDEGGDGEGAGGEGGAGGGKEGRPKSRKQVTTRVCGGGGLPGCLDFRLAISS